MTLQLRDYQLTALRFLHQHPRAGLFLDMGLGKTAVTLRALTPDHLPAVVVAPKRVAQETWPTEIDLWRPDLSVGMALGSPGARADAIDAQRDVTVVSRDNAKDLIATRGNHPRHPWRTLIIDELSGYKSRGVRWKIARRLITSPKSSIQNVWGLTGTPSPNGLMDLFTQVNLLDGGKRLGTTVTGYRERFFVPGRRLQDGTVVEWLPRPEAKEKIFHLLEDLCLSMTTEGRVELPPTVYNDVNITLPATVEKAYKDFKKDLVAVLGPEAFSAANSAVLTGRLSQLTSGFLYSDENDVGAPPTWLHDEKVKATAEVVAETGSPVLVFYRFQEEQEMLRKEFGEAARTMDSPNVVKDWNAGRVPVLLAHPASAGHGLNLQHGGHTIVWSSPPWSLEEYQQGNKRLARSGQRNTVVVHRIKAHTRSGALTIDHLIYDRLDTKRDIQNELIHHLEAPLL